MKINITITQVITFSLLFLFMVVPCITHAQPGFGDDVDDVPIDGGLSLLVAAGVGYGVKKIKQGRAKNQQA